MKKAITVAAASIAILVGIAYYLTIGAGKPISGSLSVIGQGKPVLVLVYENYSPAGGDALNRIRKIRNDYDSRIAFVVAELGTPEGDAFANRYQLRDGQAAFIEGGGLLIELTDIPVDEQVLRNRLDTMLAAGS